MRVWIAIGPYFPWLSYKAAKLPLKSDATAKNEFLYHGRCGLNETLFVQKLIWVPSVDLNVAGRRYMAGILRKRRKIQNNQSINQSNNQSINQSIIYKWFRPAPSMTTRPNEQNMLEHDIKHKQKKQQEKKLHTFKPSQRLTNIHCNIRHNDVICILWMKYVYMYLYLRNEIWYIFVTINTIMPCQPSFSVNAEIAFIFNQCYQGSSILNI